MSTKNDKHLFVEQSFSTSENQYYNLNLNPYKKCPILVPVQSYSKPNNVKYCAYENSNETVATDLLDDGNIEGLKEEKLGSIKTSKYCFTDRLMV
uniref:Uncharacterized protein n=1 Tax=Panagrolaimus sp. PS1159 TaxID=55785 RepID=A0AC35G2F9_9BILA